jgi:hypothetical protein
LQDPQTGAAPLNASQHRALGQPAVHL